MRRAKTMLGCYSGDAIQLKRALRMLPCEVKRAWDRMVLISES
jgi:hypothetical protein